MKLSIIGLLILVALYLLTHADECPDLSFYVPGTMSILLISRLFSRHESFEGGVLVLVTIQKNEVLDMPENKSSHWALSK